MEHSASINFALLSSAQCCNQDSHLVAYEGIECYAGATDLL